MQQLVQHILGGQRTRVIDRRAIRVEHHPDQRRARPSVVACDLKAADTHRFNTLGDAEPGAAARRCRYVRHLARQESDLYHGLYSVLLETIARDIEKHAHVLRYLLRRLESLTSL